VQLVQILACQRRPKPPLHRVGKDCDGSLLHLRRQLPIGFSPSQLMDYRLVSFPPLFPRESPHLPLCDADLLGRLFSMSSLFRNVPNDGASASSCGVPQAS
jgi:hypothetical protein